MGKNIVYKILLLVCLSAVLGAASGCGPKSVAMRSAPAPELCAVPAGKAAIVFYRPASGEIPAPIAEHVEGDVRHVAVLGAKTGYCLLTEPGKHVYVVGGESCHLLEASLEGGKTYYVRLEEQTGIWEGRFAFRPVIPVEPEKTEKELCACGWCENGPEAKAWFLEHRPTMMAKYAVAFANFTAASEAERAIVRPGYGFDEPLNLSPGKSRDKSRIAGIDGSGK